MENRLTQYNAGSIFAAYASISASFTLATQMYRQFTPEQLRVYIEGKIKEWFRNRTISDPKIFRLVIKQKVKDFEYNGAYAACEAYLSDKVRSDATATHLEGNRSRNPKETLSYSLAAKGVSFVEYVNLDENHTNVKLEWKFSCKNNNGEEDENGCNKSFELSCLSQYKDLILNTFIPSVILEKYDKMVEQKKESFFTPTMLKKSILDDLDRFIRRKEFYKKIGRPWKRGYLLYGPPGTGKSSLIAAIANYLKTTQDDYSTSDNSQDDSDDGDNHVRCGADNTNNNQVAQAPANPQNTIKLSLSGLLNFIDGLWTSCGEERIIIVTTNHKERLDPALLRPGRMDMHIHLSYLKMPAFRVLASNYLDLVDHPLFEKIENLLQITDVSPAEVAEEFIRTYLAPNLRPLPTRLEGRHKEEGEEIVSMQKRDEDECCNLFELSFDPQNKDMVPDAFHSLGHGEKVRRDDEEEERY
ncbi:hypothetical protein RDABS01_038788 [Bienertia sinuspersici]